MFGEFATLFPATVELAFFAMLLAVYLVGTAFRAYVVRAEPSWAEQSLLWLPMFLDLFAIGMALAIISAASSVGRPIPRLFAWLGEHPWLAWGIAVALFLVVTRLDYPDRPFGLHSTDGSSDYLPRQFLYGLASIAWLAPAIFGDQSRSRLRQVLSSRVLVYLGAISLSFYLWHLEFIEQLKAWTVPDWDVIVERAAHLRHRAAYPADAMTCLALLIVDLLAVRCPRSARRRQQRHRPRPRHHVGRTNSARTPRSSRLQNEDARFPSPRYACRHIGESGAGTGSRI